jgi:aldehyde:ferredoxin oxidoreductase
MGMIKRGPYAGAICDNVEYESVGLIGGNLAVSSVEAMAFINQTCDKLGLDTISTGGVVGFAIEAFERGLLDETSSGGLKLSFGDHRSILKLIHQIAHREGLGGLLADGVVEGAERLGKGAPDFACAIQGLETPAWGPRGSAGMGLAYVTGDRGGCHQRGFPIGYETSGSWPKGEMADGWHLEGKGELVSWEQNLLAALYSLTICEFGRSGVSYDTYRSMLAAATGLSLSEEEFLLVGERIWNLIRLFNLREGWTQDQARVPQRFKEALPSGVMKGHAFTDEDIAALLEQYNTARGWDDSGRPLARTLTRLGVDALMEPLFEGK